MAALRMSTFRGVQLSSAPVVRAAPVVNTRIVASKIVEGKVISDKTDKTVTVLVQRYKIEPRYGKRVRTSKKYHVHDEANECEVGDTVEIVTTIPVSKTKAHKVSRIVKKFVKI